MDLELRSYKRNLCKANIYKAESHKTDSFFVYQMKVSLKTTLCKVNIGVLLKLLLSTIRSSFFIPSIIPQSKAFLNRKNLCWTEISSPYQAPWFKCFPTTLCLISQFGRVRRTLKIVLKFFEICSPVYPPIITATTYFFMFISIFTF